MKRSYTVKGRPLEEIGLQCAVLIHADGRTEPFPGVAIKDGQTILEAVEESIPVGARVEIEHDWIPHYRAFSNRPDAYVCAKCPAVREIGPEDNPADVLASMGITVSDGLREHLEQPTALEQSAKKQTSSAGRWWGRSVIYGKEDEHATPYMTRYWIGRLRLHIFHRGDQDPDCHDHPWDFWTFPFTPYVEEVVVRSEHPMGLDHYFTKHRQIVPAWRVTFRPAEHCHRVLNRARRVNPKREKGYLRDDKSRYYVDAPGPIVTLVWRGSSRRKWGFLKDRDGKWCWVNWKAYVFGGGKHAPCE